jgi:AraC-like DNA-binding protein
MLRLWRAVMDEADDQLLGLHVGKSPTVTDFGLVGYAMRYSNNLLDALHRLARYQRIISEGIRFTLNEYDEACELNWVMHPALLAIRHPIESSMTVLVRTAREITSTDLSPLKVALPTPPPQDPRPYRAEFGCDVTFGCDVAAITWSRQQMQLPTVAGDAALAGYLDELATIAAGPISADKDSAITAVRRALWAMLPRGRPSIWRTARELGVSVRTLQRRLGEEGSSFSEVLDTLRRDVTRELLADGNQPAADISFLLGYAEPSSFHRAYRRWLEDSSGRGVN